MRRFVPVLFIVVLVGAAAADAVATEGAYTATAVYSGFGARAKAMGGEITSLTDESHLWLYNPAGVLGFDTWRLAGDFTWLDESVQGGFASITSPVLRDRVGFALGGGGAMATGLVGSLDPPVVYSQSQYFGRAASGVDLGRGFFGGAAVDVSRRRYHDETVYGTSMDLGMLYHIDQYWSLGAAWRGLTLDEMQYADRKVGPSWTWNAGGSLNRYPLAELTSLSARLGVAQVEDDDTQLHLGLEIARTVAVSTKISLRFGYNGEGAAVGAGLRWRWISADYAFTRLPASDYFEDYGHTVSVSMSPLTAMRALLRRDEAALEDYRNKQFRQHLQEGQRQMDRQNYVAARESFLQAEAFAVSEEQRRQALQALSNIGRQLTLQRERQDSLLISRARDSIAAIEQRWRERVAELQADYEQGLARTERRVIEETVERYRSEIPSLIEEDRYHDALGRITFVLDHRPDDSATLAWREEVRREIAAMVKRPQPESPEQLLEELDSIFRDRLGIDETVGDSLVDVWYQQGINYSREGEYRKAIEQWRKVLQARPEHPTVRQDIEVARRRLEARSEDTSNSIN
jgi:tetratricopeptide (TPR) repeat protein